MWVLPFYRQDPYLGGGPDHLVSVTDDPTGQLMPVTHMRGQLPGLHDPLR